MWSSLSVGTDRGDGGIHSRRHIWLWQSEQQLYQDGRSRMVWVTRPGSAVRQAQILALPFCDFRENYFSKPPLVIFKVEGTAATAMVISGAGKAASQA